MLKVILASAMLMAGTAEARSISPFTLPQMNGLIEQTEFSTDDYEDGIYVIEVYQLRCGYCDDNAPNMAAMAEEFAGVERIKFIDLGIDSSDRDYHQWIARHNVQHYVLKDAGARVFSELGGRGTPTSYVLDSDLNVLWEHEGVWTSFAKEDLRNLLSDMAD